MARQTPDSIRLHFGAQEPPRELGARGLSSEELLATLGALPSTLFVVDRKRRITAYAGVGTPSDYFERDLLEVVQPEHRAFYEAQLGRVLDGGEVVTFDVASAGEGWQRVRLAPLVVDDDIRGAVSLAHGLDQVQAEPPRDPRIRATFEQVNEGMLVVDLASGNVVACNQAATRLLQVPTEELTDTAPSWLQLAPEHGARLGWGALLDDLCDGRTLRGRAILRDAQEAHVELRATVRHVGDERIAFVLCRDISEDLKEERARATQERLATVGSLAAGVAHEINNPLAYVIANVQFALERLQQAGKSDEKSQAADERQQLQDALMEANEGARRVQRIVADLKTLARQGDGVVEPINVEHTLQWAIGVTMAEIRQRARLVKDLKAVAPVRGDEARLGQVFVNVLLNAAQAITAGHASENEILLKTWAEDGRVLIEVSDTGPGIPEQDLTRIFDPFYTTKPRGIGTGLGLSICHEIIASMRGSLTAGNLKPHGARFLISLPALTSAQLTPLLQERERAQSVLPNQTRARVLIIDDEKLTAKALARLLRDHEVSVADHAPKGLELALSGDFDVIFCDLMMPDLSGMAVHAQVARARPEVAERMIFITGGTFTEEARVFASTHAARCLFKPFEPSLVRGTLAKIMLEAQDP